MSNVYHEDFSLCIFAIGDRRAVRRLSGDRFFFVSKKVAIVALDQLPRSCGPFQKSLNKRRFGDGVAEIAKGDGVASDGVRCARLGSV